MVERRGADADVHRRPGGPDPRPGARGAAGPLPRHQPGQLLLVRVRARHLRPGRPRDAARAHVRARSMASPVRRPFYSVLENAALRRRRARSHAAVARGADGLHGASAGGPAPRQLTAPLRADGAPRRRRGGAVRARRRRPGARRRRGLSRAIARRHRDHGRHAAGGPPGRVRRPARADAVPRRARRLGRRVPQRLLDDVVDQSGRGEPLHVALPVAAPRRALRLAPRRTTR